MKENKQHTNWSRQGYVSEFLALRCAGDVLNVVSPLGAKAKKEVTESMSIIHAMRSLVLPVPMKYALVDLCAGNALTSVLAQHLLPIKRSVAVDKRRRKRSWSRIRGFEYVNCSIEEFYTRYLEIRRCGRVSLCDYYSPCILAAVHPCSQAAVAVVDLFIRWDAAEHLIMMPCCIGGIDRTEKTFTALEHDKLGRYERWCLYLAGAIHNRGWRVNVRRDVKCLSPCNIVVTASK